MSVRKPKMEVKREERLRAITGWRTGCGEGKDRDFRGREWSFEIFNPPNCEVTNPSSDTFVFVRDRREEEEEKEEEDAETPTWILLQFFDFGKEPRAEGAKSVVIPERERVIFVSSIRTEWIKPTWKEGLFLHCLHFILQLISRSLYGAHLHYVDPRAGERDGVD